MKILEGQEEPRDMRNISSAAGCSTTMHITTHGDHELSWVGFRREKAQENPEGDILQLIGMGPCWSDVLRYLSWGGNPEGRASVFADRES